MSIFIYTDHRMPPPPERDEEKALRPYRHQRAFAYRDDRELFASMLQIVSDSLGLRNPEDPRLSFVVDEEQGAYLDPAVTDMTQLVQVASSMRPTGFFFTLVHRAKFCSRAPLCDRLLAEVPAFEVNVPDDKLRNEIIVVAYSDEPDPSRKARMHGFMFNSYRQMHASVYQILNRAFLRRMEEYDGEQQEGPETMPLVVPVGAVCSFRGLMDVAADLKEREGTFRLIVVKHARFCNRAPLSRHVQQRLRGGGGSQLSSAPRHAV